MAEKFKVKWLERFAGYSDIVNAEDTPKLTKDLNNVKVRYGRLVGRGGMSKYLSISTPSSANIIGLFNYRQVDGSHELIRLLTTDIEHISAGAWVSIKGALTLNGTTITRPQFTIIDDTLIYSNEGYNRPRKYAGTGVADEIAAGTAPFGKGVVAYLGFLFIFNVSSDGTFTDIYDGHRTGYYSDDWDHDWSLCGGNSRVLDETPGTWLAAVVIGRVLFCLKSDGVVTLTFSPSSSAGIAIRFQQSLLAGKAGILSPLSLDSAGQALAFYLGTDVIIYMIDPNGVNGVSDPAVVELLRATIPLNKLQYARGMVNLNEDRYYLFYDRTGLALQLLDSYVAYNYKSKEWVKGKLGKPINCCSNFQSTDQATEELIVSTETLVESFDSTAIDDDGVAIPSTRYWTSNWQKMDDEGWFCGARLILERNGFSRIRVQISTDFSPGWTWDRYFSLRGASVDDAYVTIDSKIPPQLCESFNIRVEFLHDTTAARTVLQKVGFIVQPNVAQVDTRPDRSTSAMRA